MSAIFPGAPDLAAYWANLVAGKNAVTEVPRERWNPEIFYDPSGRRRKRFAVGLGLFILLNLLTIAALFATIRVVPAQPPLPVAYSSTPSCR